MTHYLTADRYLNSLSIRTGGGLILNHYNPPYTPHHLTIGAGGIRLYGLGKVYIRGPGFITSSQQFMNIDSNTDGELFIESVIRDNINKRIGLRISGTHRSRTTIVLAGNSANTFTGNVEVSGIGNVLALAKAQGVAASHGDFLIKNGGVLELRRGSQISDGSTVRLKSGTLKLTWNGGSSRSDIFHKLAIEEHSRLQFEYWKGIGSGLYLDELIISDASLLEVQGWKAGRDWLLVRKTSKSLSDALRKIRFEGYDPNAVHLEEYNKEYWVWGDFCQWSFGLRFLAKKTKGAVS